jgi:4-aminobutyrate aminotransferase/(S)-3-amino-2-methylpropionate transaminase
LLTTDAIAGARPWSNPSGSSSSYGGNALGAAAGAAALRAIDDEALVDNAAAVGDWMLGELRAFEDDYPFVGHVRGRGLMIGVELVADRATRKPLARSVTERIFHGCVRRGLLTMSYAPSFRIQPALTIDRATAANGVAILREVFDDLKAVGGWQGP